MNTLEHTALELRKSLGRLRRAVDAFAHAQERARFKLRSITPYVPIQPTEAEVIHIEYSKGPVVDEERS